MHLRLRLPPSDAVESALPAYLLRSRERLSGGEALGMVAGGAILLRLPLDVLAAKLPAAEPLVVQGGHACDARGGPVSIACDISVVLNLNTKIICIVSRKPQLEYSCQGPWKEGTPLYSLSITADAAVKLKKLEGSSDRQLCRQLTQRSGRAGRHQCCCPGHAL